MNTPWIVWVLHGVVIVCLTLAVITDLHAGKIYNVVTLPAIVLGLTLNTLAHGWHGLWFSLAGLGIAALTLPLQMIKLGAGDIKLLGAVGALTGPIFLLWTLLGTALAGLLLGLCVAAQRGVLHVAWRDTLLAARVVATVGALPVIPGQAGRMAYAPAIALGVIFAAWHLRGGSLR